MKYYNVNILLIENNQGDTRLIKESNQTSVLVFYAPLRRQRQQDRAEVDHAGERRGAVLQAGRPACRGWLDRLPGPLRWLQAVGQE